MSFLVRSAQYYWLSARSAPGYSRTRAMNGVLRRVRRTWYMLSISARTLYSIYTVVRIFFLVISFTKPGHFQRTEEVADTGSRTSYYSYYSHSPVYIYICLGFVSRVGLSPLPSLVGFRCSLRNRTPYTSKYFFWTCCTRKKTKKRKKIVVPAEKCQTPRASHGTPA